MNIPELYKAVRGIAAVFLGAVFCFIMYHFSWKAHSTLSKFIFFGIAPLLTLSIRPYLLPEFAVAGKDQGGFVMDVSKYISPDTIVVSHMNMMHAVAWYLKRSDIYLWMNPGELQYAVDLPQNQYRLIKNNSALNQLIEEQKGRGGVATFQRGDYRENFPMAPTAQSYEDNLMFGFFKK